MPKMRKSPFNIVILSIFKLRILSSYQLEFLHQGVHLELLFSQKWIFFVKVMCCMFDQTFLRPFDGKIAEQLRLLFKFGVEELQINKVWKKNDAINRI